MKNRSPSPHPVTQRTLKSAITYVGIGLHTGEKVSMTVRPAPPNNGIIFERKDVEPGIGLVPARWYFVSTTDMSTSLKNEHDVSVHTVEHLLAALHGCGVDNALIELDAEEVPIMDGSSDPFVKMIEHIGTVEQSAPRHAIWIHSPIEIQHKENYAILLPHNTPRITVSIDFPHQAIGFQTHTVELVNEAFRNDVARARTFGFKDQIDTLQGRGLIKGGSLRNAVLVDGDRIVNKEGLRFENEFVRHKILDCLGDLSLAGVPIFGHYFAHRPGHALNTALLRKLFEERSAWSYITVEEYNTLMGIKPAQIQAQDMSSDDISIQEEVYQKQN